MTTSSSERCTRISPSAIIDECLAGEDLEWALDHLNGCPTCRERVEEFREIVVRLERLPSAAVSPQAVNAAYAWAIPEAFRSAVAGTADQEPIRPPVPGASPAALVDVTSSAPQTAPRAAEPYGWAPGRRDIPPVDPGLVVGEPTRVEEPTRPPDSERWFPTRRAQAVDEPMLPLPTVEPGTRQRFIESGQDGWARPKAAPSSDVADRREELEAAPAESPPESRERDSNLLRLAVGLVAAACILLAGILYGQSGLWRILNRTAITQSPKVSATVRPNASPSGQASLSPSPRASLTPTPVPSPPVPVVASLGDGATGVKLYNVRYGTADARYTRIVFDMAGSGFPTMVVTKPDDTHLVVTLKEVAPQVTSIKPGTRLPRVSDVEGPVQQGQDLIATIVLSTPVNPAITTLPPEPGKGWRLVVDLYSA